MLAKQQTATKRWEILGRVATKKNRCTNVMNKNRRKR
jgi:hypothetical protein